MSSEDVEVVPDLYGIDDQEDSDNENEIDDKEMMEVILGKTLDLTSGRVKHERVNRRQERRRKKKGYAVEAEKNNGFYVEYNPSSGVKKLPTTVRVLPGSKKQSPVILVKK